MEGKRNQMGKIKNNTDLTKQIALNDGRIPPNQTDFERIVIGTLLIDKKAFDAVSKRFGKNANIFYDPRHSVIYKTIQDLNDNKIPIDLLTVIQELKRTSNLLLAGGDHYVIDLTMGVSSSAHLDYHLMTIWQSYLLRKMINACGLMIEKAYDDNVDVPLLFNDLQKEIFEIEEEIAAQQDTKTAQDLFVEVIEQQKTKMIPGVQCKNKGVQRKMNGWRNGSLIVLGARPAMGKTAFVLDEALGIAKQGNPVAFVSFEMSAIELQERQMANELQISGTKFRDRCLTDHDWERIYKCTTFENLPLFIVEGKTVNFELNRTLARLRLLKKEKGIKLIIWDYIQLTEVVGLDKGKNREQLISTISRKMKQLAMELDVPIIALSQLSRSVESRPGKRPQLADLRESGAIEQDADVVGFLFRPEYYKIALWDNDPEGQETPTTGQAELMIEKFRGGSVFTERMIFRGDYQRFYELDEEYGEFKNPIPLGNLQDAFEKPSTQLKPLIKDDDIPF